MMTKSHGLYRCPDSTCDQLYEHSRDAMNCTMHIDRRDLTVSLSQQLIAMSKENDALWDENLRLRKQVQLNDSTSSQNVTPEQIVYSTAQRDPGFRKHLIEQLTAMDEVKMDRD